MVFLGHTYDVSHDVCQFCARMNARLACLLTSIALASVAAFQYFLCAHVRARPQSSVSMQTCAHTVGCWVLRADIASRPLYRVTILLEIASFSASPFPPRRQSRLRTISGISPSSMPRSLVGDVSMGTSRDVLRWFTYSRVEYRPDQAE